MIWTLKLSMIAMALLMQVESAAANQGSPLFLAAFAGRVELVRILIVRGAKLDLVNADGATPLFVAAQNGHVKVVRELAIRGAKLDLANEEGATPLFVASQQGHLKVVRELLARGAKANLAMQDGVTPLLISHVRGHYEIIGELIAYGQLDLSHELELAQKFDRPALARRISRAIRGTTGILLVDRDGLVVVAREFEELSQAVKDQGLICHRSGLEILQTNEKQIEKSLKSLKENLEKSTLEDHRKLQVVFNELENKIIEQQCPVCMDSLSGKTRYIILQCNHKICGSCHPKLNLDDLCPLCRSVQLGENYFEMRLSAESP